MSAMSRRQREYVPPPRNARRGPPDSFVDRFDRRRPSPETFNRNSSIPSPPMGLNPKPPMRRFQTNSPSPEPHHPNRFNSRRSRSEANTPSQNGSRHRTRSRSPSVRPMSASKLDEMRIPTTDNARFGKQQTPHAPTNDRQQRVSIPKPSLRPSPRSSTKMPEATTPDDSYFAFADLPDSHYAAASFPPAESNGGSPPKTETSLVKMTESPTKSQAPSKIISSKKSEVSLTKELKEFKGSFEEAQSRIEYLEEQAHFAAIDRHALHSRIQELDSQVQRLQKQTELMQSSLTLIVQKLNGTNPTQPSMQ